MGLICNLDTTTSSEVVTTAPVFGQARYISPVHSPVKIVKTIGGGPVPLVTGPVHSSYVPLNSGVVYSPGGTTVLRTSGTGHARIV